jgi:hypothetical protein
MLIGLALLAATGLALVSAALMVWRLARRKGRLAAPSAGILLGCMILLVTLAFMPEPISQARTNSTDIANITKIYRAQWDANSNPAQDPLIRTARAQALCKLSYGTITLRGTVSMINSASVIAPANQAGLTFDAVIGPHVSISTGSDDAKPGSALFAQLADVQAGARLDITGHFQPSTTDCWREISITTNGGMNDPVFIFHPSSITPQG